MLRDDLVHDTEHYRQHEHSPDTLPSVRRVETRQPEPEKRSPLALDTRLLLRDTANADVTHAGVDHLRLARGWAITMSALRFFHSRIMSPIRVTKRIVPSKKITPAIWKFGFVNTFSFPIRFNDR